MSDFRPVLYIFGFRNDILENHPANCGSLWKYLRITRNIFRFWDGYKNPWNYRSRKAGSPIYFWAHIFLLPLPVWSLALSNTAPDNYKQRKDRLLNFEKIRDKTIRKTLCFGCRIFTSRSTVVKNGHRDFDVTSAAFRDGFPSFSIRLSRISL